MGNNARIVDVNLIRQAGIRPTRDELAHSLEGKREPTRAVEATLYEAIKKDVRVIDEQNAVSRFTWYNLPMNITGQELERWLYYKGQLAFFFIPELGEFFFMPYALNGTIDFYGRFNSIKPVPMSNGATNSDGNKAVATQADILSRMRLQCVYGIPVEPVDPNKVCVLLHDHVKQMSETIIPRQQMNDPLCGLEAELIAYMRTNAISGSGVKGMRVGSDDEQINVAIGNCSFRESALKGEVFTPMIGNVEWQNLMENGDAKMEEYFQAFQAVDNLRLSTYGLGEGQMFEKKAHMLQTEADNNQSNVGIVLSSDLAIRQNFCHIVNSIWGLGIWCEANEAYSGNDVNGDGDTTNRDDGSQSAVDTGGQEDGK